MKKWNPEQVEKLRQLVEHRDYVVMLNESVVAKVTPVQSVPNPENYNTSGWFGFGTRGYGSEIEDDHELDDYEFDDFKVFQIKERWWK